MPEQTLYLTTYTYNSSENKFEYISLTGKQHDTEEENRIWQNLLPAIRASPILSSQAIQIHEGESALDLSIPQIILLFIQSKDLANPRFFDALAKGGGLKLRPYVKPSKRHKKNESTIYHPVITIGYPDITYLYSEEKESRGQHEWNKLIYECIELDKRFKVLDSSIWHRYVPVDPFDGTFSSVFEEVIADVIDYHRQGLYFTNASVISLEFQMRMLLHSYVARFGNKGHSEVVTPFKFHSERQKARSAQVELLFFHYYWRGVGKLSQVLRWRLLIVDDQAGVPMSFIDDRWNLYFRHLKKADLIVQPFYKICQDVEAVFIDYKKNDPEKDIVNDSISKITDTAYDILFVDYLLGIDSSSGEREYGHELILKLLQDNRSSIPILKKDYNGKYWIFPISSYPYALADKLMQLGISYLHEIWNIANGADPVSMPHLYAYDLMRFLKYKISYFFISPNALKTIFNQLPFDLSNINKANWLNSLITTLDTSQSKYLFLGEGSELSDSPQMELSLQTFLKRHYGDVIQSLYADIKNILKIISVFLDEDKYIDESSFNEIQNALKKLKYELYSDYHEVLNVFENRIDILISEKYLVYNKINTVVKNNDKNLYLNELKLHYVPTYIEKAHDIECLYLNNNLLRTLPGFIKDLPGLKYIDLSDNEFEDFPEVLVEMNQLEGLDFSNNNMPYLTIFKAQNAMQVLRMYYDFIIEMKLNKAQISINSDNLEKAFILLDSISVVISRLGYQERYFPLKNQYELIKEQSTISLNSRSVDAALIRKKIEVRDEIIQLINDLHLHLSLNP